jgi:ABC-type phosphate transport system auxiliary subunit
MQNQTSDVSVLRHIEELVSQEHQLQTQASLSDEERARLRAVEVELDQSWDLLRQRRALRAVGQDPDRAQVRAPDIVEKYEQ